MSLLSSLAESIAESVVSESLMSDIDRSLLDDDRAGYAGVMSHTTAESPAEGSDGELDTYSDDFAQLSPEVSPGSRYSEGQQHTSGGLLSVISSQDASSTYSDDFASSAEPGTARPGSLGSLASGPRPSQSSVSAYSEAFEAMSLSPGPISPSIEESRVKGIKPSQIVLGGQRHGQQLAPVRERPLIEEEAKLALENEGLRGSLEAARAQLDKIRQRDLLLLTRKQARARMRRSKHEEELGEARRQMTAARRHKEQLEVELGRTKALLEVAQAHEENAKTECERLRSERQSLLDRVSVLERELCLEKDLHCQTISQHSREKAERERRFDREQESLRTQLAEERARAKAEQTRFEDECLRSAREHEARVDRLQKMMEAEAALLAQERVKVKEEQLAGERKLEELAARNASSVEEQRRRLDGEQRRFQLERSWRQKEADERERAVEQEHNLVQLEIQRVAAQKSELGILRGCVEAERDKLTAARAEANAAADRARREQAEAANLQREAEALVTYNRERAAELERERKELNKAAAEVNEKAIAAAKELQEVHHIKQELLLAATETERLRMTSDGLREADGLRPESGGSTEQGPEDPGRGVCQQDRSADPGKRSRPMTPQPAGDIRDEAEDIWQSPMVRQMLEFRSPFHT